MRASSAVLGLVCAMLAAGCASSPYPVYDLPGVDFSAPASEGLANLEFLVGCWRGGSPDGPKHEEAFSIAGSGTIMGWSRQTRNARLGEWEFFRIFDDVSDVYLEVWPRGERSSARFRLTQVIPEAQATFEDPDHDFPRRIRYQLIQPDVMQIVVDGGAESPERLTSLTVVRVPCDAS